MCITNKKQNMINIINKILLQILIWYLNYRFMSKFNEIQSKTTLLTTGTSLTGLLKHILNVYQTELNDKGLVGLYKLRRIILAQINELSISKFWNRDRKLDELELQASLKQLYIFKDILSNIRYSVEMLMLIKSIIYFISSAAIIPFLVTAVYVFFKRLILFFSVTFSGFFAAHYTVFWVRHTFKKEIIAYMEVLRSYSIRFHNWLFSDHMVTAPCEPTPDSYIMIIADKQPVRHSIWEYLPSPSFNTPDWIDWSLVGYTTGAIVIVGTTWAIYTGAVDPISLSKRLGGFITAYFLGTTDDGDNSGPTPDIELVNIQSSKGIFDNVRATTPDLVIPQETDSTEWAQTAGASSSTGGRGASTSKIISQLPEDKNWNDSPLIDARMQREHDRYFEEQDENGKVVRSATYNNSSDEDESETVTANTPRASEVGTSRQKSE